MGLDWTITGFNVFEKHMRYARADLQTGGQMIAHSR